MHFAFWVSDTTGLAYREAVQMDLKRATERSHSDTSVANAIQILDYSFWVATGHSSFLPLRVTEIYVIWSHIDKYGREFYPFTANTIYIGVLYLNAQLVAAYSV